MGQAGLRQATQHAVLNANYMARRLNDYYQIMFTNNNGKLMSYLHIQGGPENWTIFKIRNSCIR